VHSYHFTPIYSGDLLAISGYGNSNFVSAVKRNNICGFQFHPEKSGRSGELLVKEVLDWARNEN
jgi:glutamine amidotransferase